MPPSARIHIDDLDHLMVGPWVDRLVDDVGHDVRSAYVERFWLGILGPSATWFLRHVAARFDTEPDGFSLDLAICAGAIGLGRHKGTRSAFPRMLQRCCQFKVARVVEPTAIEVRRRLPPLNRRQIAKLSPVLQAEHQRWVDSSPTVAEVATLSDRARRLALSLFDLGEDPAGTERQLRRWRFHPALAREATSWAAARRSPAGRRTPDPSGTPDTPHAPQPLPDSGP